MAREIEWVQEGGYCIEGGLTLWKRDERIDRAPSVQGQRSCGVDDSIGACLHQTKQTSPWILERRISIDQRSDFIATRGSHDSIQAIWYSWLAELQYRVWSARGFWTRCMERVCVLTMPQSDRNRQRPLSIRGRDMREMTRSSKEGGGPHDLRKEVRIRGMTIRVSLRPI